jgi:CheY-like chemotaxis protein
LQELRRDGDRHEVCDFGTTERIRTVYPMEPPVSWTVFLIEDDHDLRTTLAEILEARGYRVHAAQNGKLALEQLRDVGLRPAVILLDMMMPVMDGHEFIHQLSVDPAISSLPIVITTAQPIDATVFGDRVKAVLFKPLSLPNLLGVISDVCQGRRTTDRMPAMVVAPPPVPPPSLAIGTAANAVPEVPVAIAVAAAPTASAEAPAEAAAIETPAIGDGVLGPEKPT